MLSGDRSDLVCTWAERLGATFEGLHFVELLEGKGSHEYQDL